MQADAGLHLTYCSNIHAARGWPEVFASLRAYAPRLKRLLAPAEPFGLGLRLSSLESEQLLAGEELHAFQDFLARHGLYVFTLNGFPFGDFHGGRIKSSVFAPDWRDPSRLRYTLRLVEILRRLLPVDTEGSISTLPLSYRPWIRADDVGAWCAITIQLLKLCERLVEIREQEGRWIHLDLEPEPGGLIAGTRDAVEFFERWLLPLGIPWLARRLHVARPAARRHLLDHLQICFDTCHAAVGFEDTAGAIDHLGRAGIGIGKLQVSAALEIALAGGRQTLAERLAPFAESTYLHQTAAEQPGGRILRYPDLPEALRALAGLHAGRLRTHFHVPVFVDHYGEFRSTGAETRAALALLRAHRFTRHVEIETYTWEVLPAGLKLDLLASIEREYRWVLAGLEPPPLRAHA